MKRKGWFEIHNAAAKGGTPVEVFIYDDIGMWGISANEFVSALNELGDVAEINVRINSGGGSVIEGVAIYNALMRHPARINGFIDSVAASIASLIAMACDHLTIYDTSMMMVHRASAGAGGTADELRQCADVLDMIDKMLARTYAGKTGKSSDEIMALLDATTYMDAAQALDLGFVDEIAAMGDGQTPEASSRNDIEQYIHSIASVNTRELIAASAQMPQWLNQGIKNSDGSGRRDQGKKGGDTMELEELKAQLKKVAGIDVDGLNNQVSTLTNELNTARAKATEAQAALSGVLGELSADEATASIAAGQAYRASLVDEVVKARRQLGLTGDSDEDVAQATALLSGYSLDQLKAEANALVAKTSGTEQFGQDSRNEEQSGGRRSHRKTRKENKK
ncbi:head maturation protease, ClpP-related [Mariprofundus ferrooxydans]|uniref:head maturation protease, ClpP-related n=1 Tax=Mariprofundus ferrooxydans TaxID=314344 RepID=UPI001431B6BE|nr:head maturation protease, ClpP-related [Mariprofundus ferrooxydans]